MSQSVYYLRICDHVMAAAPDCATSLIHFMGTTMGSIESCELYTAGYFDLLCNNNQLLGPLSP